MINSNVYIIDFERLINWLNATFLRAPKYIKYLQAILTPLQRFYNNFMLYKADAIYRVSHNSQKCYMQKVLNDKFDNDLRRIEIRNARIFEPNWFYHPEDDKPLFFYDPEDNKPVYFYDPADFNGDGVDFTVVVPLDMQPATPQDTLIFETKLKAFVDYYKLYTKNYIITYE